MLIFGAWRCSKNEVFRYTISRLWLFQAVPLLAQHYTVHLTIVTTAQRSQWHKQTLFVATDMLIFGAWRCSKNEVFRYTISSLCSCQAVLLLAQHYKMYLTTVTTAPRRQCHKRTLLVATDMLNCGAWRCSKNEVLCYTISRLRSFQAVLLLAQHFTRNLTTVTTAPKRQCHTRILFVVTDMLIFSAFKSSKNEVFRYTISSLWLFQAVPLLAQHYTMHLTTVITAPRRQCHKRTLLVATDMLIFGAFK
jgi:uncharacterized membrane protein